MAFFAGKRRGKPFFDGCFRFVERKESQPKRKCVGIIVFTGGGEHVEVLSALVGLFFCRPSVIERATNAFETVGDHRFALTGRAGNYCATILASEYVGRKLPCRPRDDRGIVIVFVIFASPAALDFCPKFVPHERKKLVRSEEH